MKRILKDRPELVVSWVIQGLYFGYPMCCIGEFVLRPGQAPKRKFYGTGYVPCIKCNQKSEKELLAYIQANRLAKYPFPNDSK